MLIGLNENLKKQYENVELIENDPTYNKRFDNQGVALDSGMIKIVKNSTFHVDVFTAHDMKTNSFFCFFKY